MDSACRSMRTRILSVCEQPGLPITKNRPPFLNSSNSLTLLFLAAAGRRLYAGSGFAAGLFGSETRIDFGAVLGAHARRRREIRKLHDHERGDESLQAVQIEINGGLARIGFGDHSHAVAVMLNVLAFGNRFHMSSF